MAVNISAELKRANETSLALDREQDALWQELSKYQMACTDDYTGEILFEQDRKQTESNELRYVALSKAQAHIKRLLESSSAIFETAKHGIQVLSDTVSYAEEEFTEYNRRIEEVKNRKKQALEAATCSIKQNETKIGNLHQKCSGKQGESSGMEKLSAILPELKVSENRKFEAAEADFENVERHLQSKASATNDVRQSLSEVECNCRKLERSAARMKKDLDSQKAEKNMRQALIGQLTEKKIAVSRTAEEKRRTLESLLNTHSLEELSLAKGEKESYCQKLTGVHLEMAILRNRLLSQRQNWQQRLQSEMDVISSKLGLLEREIFAKEKELLESKSQLKELKELLKRDEERTDWDEHQWEQTFKDQFETQKQLEYELMQVMDDISAANEALESTDENDAKEEAFLALEQDLLSYVNNYNEERKRIQEQRMELLSRLKTAQDKVAGLKATNAEKENEHQKLLSDAKKLQAQIDAFSNPRTPAKPANVSATKTRQTATSGQRTSRKDDEVDSDLGSSPSGVPYVEGLQPFSPATLSFKEQTKRKPRRAKSLQTEVEKPPVEPSSIVPAAQKSTSKHVNVVEIHSDGDESAVESLFDLSGSEKSLPYESLITKRFPRDIFLENSPSVGQNESGSSPEVSAMGTVDAQAREDADQSIWSTVAKPPVNRSHMDLTAETDLDQSVW